MDRSSALMTGNVKDAAAAHMNESGGSQSQEQYMAIRREVTELGAKLAAMDAKLDRLVSQSDGGSRLPPLGTHAQDHLQDLPVPPPA